MSTEKRIIVAAELRVGQSQGDEMSLIGYPARFNSESKDLGGFRETIAPGAFTRALAEKQDVFCLLNHDTSKVLGRTSSGTLTLEQDDAGLKMHCQLDPNQQWHRDIHSAVKRGDIREMSFAFTPNGEKGDEWADRKDAEGNYYISRTLKDVNLFDASVVCMPAYNTTSVQARAEALPQEIRSTISKLVEKRVKNGVEKRDEEDSMEEYISEVCKALCEKFPADSDSEICRPYGGKYWICETYEDCVIACECGSSEYVRIPYVENPDGDSFVFGTPMPVEKEWVPSERCVKQVVEMRAFQSKHMQAIADAHKDQASQHGTAAAEHADAASAHADAAAAHTAAADSAAKEAERMAKCEATHGDCDVKSCRCQNQMVSVREMGDDYEDYEDGPDDDDEEKKGTRRSARKSAEVRADESKVRTKTVGGKAYPAGAFAFVGDPNDTSTWKFPVFDADHARNALSRWGQDTGIPADKKDGVYGKIKAACKKFGIEVSEPDAKAARSYTAEEKQDLELRFKLRQIAAEIGA